jgi:hypothetical protein
MTARPVGSRGELLPLDRLVGRVVVDRDGRSAGRLQELRVEVRNGEWIVTAYVLGMAGLLERLNVGVRLVLGGRLHGRTARPDQIDLSDPDKPRLTCRREELSDT